jgi:hypothetical protein
MGHALRKGQGREPVHAHHTRRRRHSSLAAAAHITTLAAGAESSCRPQSAHQQLRALCSADDVIAGRGLYRRAVLIRGEAQSAGRDRLRPLHLDSNILLLPHTTLDLPTTTLARASWQTTMASRGESLCPSDNHLASRLPYPRTGPPT